MNERTIQQLVKKTLSCKGIDPYLDEMYDKFPGFDYYRFSYFLAQRVKPKIIVELGTQYARCTAHFAAGAPKARVVTVDYIDVCKQGLFEHDVQEHYPNIEIVLADSRDLEIAALFEDASIGIVFADSLHTYDHVLREIEVWTPKIVKGGVLLIDDLREMPDLLDLIPFKVKGKLVGLHWNPIQWPDQEYAYAIVD